MIFEIVLSLTNLDSLSWFLPITIKDKHMFKLYTVLVVCACVDSIQDTKCTHYAQFGWK